MLQRIVLLILAACLLPACRKAVPLADPASLPVRSWLDLAPGWRLRTIGPIMAGGSESPLFSSEPATLSDSGLTITLKASKDLLGFETIYYSIEASRSGELSLRLVSAIQSIEGKDQPHLASKAAFALVPGTRFVRLLYLLRASVTDHNMAILAASSTAELADLTAKVQADPSECRGNCQWVPPRVALRAEKRVAGNWVPVEP